MNGRAGYSRQQAERQGRLQQAAGGPLHFDQDGINILKEKHGLHRACFRSQCCAHAVSCIA